MMALQHSTTIYLSFPIVFLFIFFTFLFPFSIFSIGIWNLMLYQFNLWPLNAYFILLNNSSLLIEEAWDINSIFVFGHHSFFLGTRYLLGIIILFGSCHHHLDLGPNDHYNLQPTILLRTYHGKCAMCTNTYQQGFQHYILVTNILAYLLEEL